MSADLKKGFWIGLGVGGALIVLSLAAGLLRR